MKKLSKKVLDAFDDSIKRGLKEETGSMDQFEVDGEQYFVVKTSDWTFSLYEDGEIIPVLEKTF